MAAHGTPPPEPPIFRNGNRSDNPCWPGRSEVVNGRSAQSFAVMAHRTKRQAGRFHGLTERLPATRPFGRRVKS